MKKSLLFILFTLLTFCLHAQKDTTGVSGSSAGKGTIAEPSPVSLNIYPVPVKDNYFQIRSDREISLIKVTNIIGQDIFKEHYDNPQNFIKIILDNPQRGMYLVTIVFTDGVRIVKKIMVEQSE